jgi:predicted nucleotidyltransferase
MIKNERNRIQQAHLDELGKIRFVPNFPMIKHLLLFGSYAIGKPTDLSDMDLAYITNKELSFDQELELICYFNRTLHTDEIDLVSFNKAPLPLQYKILCEGKIIFSKNPAELADLKEQVFPLYFDFNYYQLEYRRAMKQGVKEQKLNASR